MQQGVTPENNAAVLFWKAMGPAVISKGYRERYFQMLGIPPLPEKGDYFVTHTTTSCSTKIPNLPRQGKIGAASSASNWKPP